MYALVQLFLLELSMVKGSNCIVTLNYLSSVNVVCASSLMTILGLTLM